MSIEDQLKQLIVEKYGSVRAFTKEIGIPYSTIDSMLKRGIGGTGVATVLLVCLALQIDIEGLLEDRITPKYATLVGTQKAPLYSREAMKLAEDYDKLGTHGQRMVRVVMDEELIRCQDTQTTQKTVEQEADEFAALAREQFIAEKKRASQTSTVKESAAG